MLWLESTSFMLWRFGRYASMRVHDADAGCGHARRRHCQRLLRYEADLTSLPPLTDEQKTEIKALSETPDGDIDTSDIPPLDETFWKDAVRNPFCQS